jgi:hypothetical protein
LVEKWDFWGLFFWEKKWVLEIPGWGGLEKKGFNFVNF